MKKIDAVIKHFKLPDAIRIRTGKKGEEAMN